jgi:signal transduction histidine kinase
VLIVTLTVLWNVALVHDYRMFRDLTDNGGSFHWVLIAVGSTLFLTIIVLASVLTAQLIARTRWSQRQSEFLASVSHELNSPLSSIKLFAQTLRGREVEVADRTRFLEKILANVDRLERMVANVLRAAEVDNRGLELPVVTRRLDLHAYLAEYVADIGALRADEVVVSLDGPTDVEVDLDPDRFRQVLDNLVDNAIRYRKEKPARLAFHLGRTDEAVELRAEDEGIGIPPDAVEDVFRRFHRIDSLGTRRGRAGMGIGLFVVRSIVAGHGGEVGAESEGEGRGLTVWIRLPAPAPRGGAA